MEDNFFRRIILLDFSKSYRYFFLSRKHFKQFSVDGDFVKIAQERYPRTDPDSTTVLRIARRENRTKLRMHPMDAFSSFFFG